jgi:Flp pilus assembly protein TadG
MISGTITRIPRGYPRGERGSALVEFAVAATATLTLTLGIIDCGRALYTYHLVSNGARLATRYAIVRGSNCSVAGCPATSTSIQTYVRSVSPGISQSQLTVVTSYPTVGSACTGSATAGCPVRIQVSYPFKFIVSLLPSFTMNMTSASQMVISQ